MAKWYPEVIKIQIHRYKNVNMDKSQMHYAKWKVRQKKDYIL